MSLPSSVLELISTAPAVGFSGSRSVVPPVVSAAVAGASGRVLVGCARGVDAAVRALVPGASVFSASSFGVGRGSFAARSSACVRAVFAAGGVWVSFPSPGRVPSGLFPSASSSRCFCGSGSGSWASLAFAVGLGCPCVVFSPCSVGCFRLSQWGFVSAGGGWFVFRPSAVQLSLF
ncbi:hypothetical protein [Microcoleus sp. herbarium5]|uniref:hypothetical protein n=1 Tax=Microcoleus sp. herbarium5 TaxID=3055434 RepID=UPI002FD1EEFE